MVVGFCAVTSFVTSLFAEIFDESYRMTACSLSFNLGITLAGFAPLVAELVSRASVYGLTILLIMTMLIMYWIMGQIIQTKGYKKLSITT